MTCRYKSLKKTGYPPVQGSDKSGKGKDLVKPYSAPRKIKSPYPKG